MLILLCILVILVILLIYINIKENFDDGHLTACSEINTKRQILYIYLQNLRNPVQGISDKIYQGFTLKEQSLLVQYGIADLCIKNVATTSTPVNLNLYTNCRALASVDMYELKVLPDVDTFYINLLTNTYEFSNLLNMLNYYATMLSCPTTDMN